MEFDGEEKPMRRKAKETKAHLEAMVLRTKPEANKRLHLTPRIAALGIDGFERSLTMIPAVPQVPDVPQVMRSSSEQEQRSNILDRLGEVPVRRTIHQRQKFGSVNQTTEASSCTYISETTTSTSREERRPDRSSLIWSRPIPSPCHICKQDLRHLNLQTA